MDIVAGLELRLVKNTSVGQVPSVRDCHHASSCPSFFFTRVTSEPFLDLNLSLPLTAEASDQNLHFHRIGSMRWSKHLK